MRLLKSSMMAITQDNASREACIALRRRGYSLRLIALELGVSASTVRHHVRDVVVGDVARVNRVYQRGKQLTGALPPSDDLAYFLGVFSGDGSLTRQPRTFKLSISCDGRYPDLIEKYVRLIERLAGRVPKVASRKGGNYFEIYLYGCDLPVLLGVPCGAKSSNGYSVPGWIFTQPSYLKGFVRGLIETDGNVYHEYRNGGWFSRCRFTATHEPIMQAFLRATTLLGYNFRHCGVDARLTVTAEVKRLALELDLTKERVFKYE